jgi:hypothetical protein
MSDQGEDKHCIVNAANGLRMVAKSDADGDTEFFVIQGGPIYQDQKWLLELQDDGSYIMLNAKSKRKIAVVYDAQGRPRLVAFAESWPAQPTHAWWIINQERSDAVDFVAELRKLRSENAALDHRAETLKGEAILLHEELQIMEANASGCLERYDSFIANASESLARLSWSEAMATDLKSRLDACTNNSHALSIQLHEKKMTMMQIATERRKKDDEASALRRDFDAALAQCAQADLDREAAKRGHEKLLREIDAVKRWIELSVVKFPGCRNAPLFVGLGGVLVAAFVLSCSNGRLRQVAKAANQQVAKQQMVIENLQDDLERDCIVQTGDVVGELGVDFSFQVLRRSVDQETERIIQIQCPGVMHSDVVVNLVFNGCEVTIHRVPSCGRKSMTWKKRFRFRTSEGLFEFKEDHMQLERGILQLVFRAYAFRNRLIRFPCHFNLAATDANQDMEYPDYDSLSQSYEGISWLEPANLDTESTASTMRESHVVFGVSKSEWEE